MKPQVIFESFVGAKAILWLVPDFDDKHIFMS